MNKEATAVTASLTAEQAITLPFNGTPTTSFKLERVIDQAAADSLRPSIENWNGNVVICQSKMHRL